MGSDLRFSPIVRSDAAPASAINAALLAMMVAGLLLSLWQRGRNDGGAIQSAG
ncbi:MAG: hypothetical protein WA208_04440 [Thermoanaerobaculia bacterium]